MLPSPGGRIAAVSRIPIITVAERTVDIVGPVVSDRTDIVVSNSIADVYLVASVDVDISATDVANSIANVVPIARVEFVLDVAHFGTSRTGLADISR